MLIILVIVALLFGSTRLPKLARSLGSAKPEFDKGLHLGSTDPAPMKVGTVTMTRAELNAKIAEREAQGRQLPPPT